MSTSRRHSRPIRILLEKIVDLKSLEREVEKMPELLGRMVIALVERLNASIEGCTTLAVQAEEEVLIKRPDGSQEVIRRLGSGEPFGEMALLRNAPRSATVRIVTAAQVFKMSPSNFAALYANLPWFRDSFNTIMESRLRELELHK